MGNEGSDGQTAASSGLSGLPSVRLICRPMATLEGRSVNIGADGSHSGVLVMQDTAEMRWVRANCAIAAETPGDRPKSSAQMASSLGNGL
mgnify:FL=1